MGIGGAFGAAMADGRIGMVECLNQRFGHSHPPSSSAYLMAGFD
jgi:hypothetical protein